MRGDRLKAVAGIMAAAVMMAGCGGSPEVVMKETVATDVSGAGDTGMESSGTAVSDGTEGSETAASGTSSAGNVGSKPANPDGTQVTEPEEKDSNLVALRAAEQELYGNKELEEIEVATAEEFQALIDNGTISNKRIILTGESYDFTEGNGIMFQNVSNVEVIGSGETRITADTGYDMVLTIYDSENILFYGVTMTHNREDNDKSLECGIVFTYNMADLRFVNCVFTNGFLAYSTGNTTLTSVNTTLSNCAWQAVVSSDSTLDFQGCVITGNGFNNEFRNPVINAQTSTVNISDTVISNNTAPSAYPETGCVWNEDNVVYSGNSW
ncbi:MAG: hypothetical protein ACI4HQ_00595 [Acetatifactor sp.]